jgi:hypothetical protein
MIAHFAKMQNIEMGNFLEDFHKKMSDIISYGKFQRNLIGRRLLNTSEDKDIVYLKYVGRFLKIGKIRVASFMDSSLHQRTKNFNSK